MQRTQRRYRAVFAALLLAIVSTGSRCASADDVASCLPSQIALTSVDDGGSGMMHGERLLVATNTSHRACSVATYPKIRLFDEKHRVIAVRRERRPIHTGAPSELRVTLAPRASVRAALRYIEGDVYPNGSCKRSSTLELTLARGTHSAAAPFPVTLCGTAAGPVVTADAFAPAP